MAVLMLLKLLKCFGTSSGVAVLTSELVDAVMAFSTCIFVVIVLGAEGCDFKLDVFSAITLEYSLLLGRSISDW